MFKRLFAALRRKHEGNVASPKDAGNVSVSKEEFTPLKFEKTDEKVELAKESVAEVQETPIATEASQTEGQSASVAIRPDFKFSNAITPNNSFEAYTLHAFDLNYALYTEASDKPEEFVKDVEDKVHELYDVHCAFGRLFNVIKNPNTQVSIGESDTMSMYVVAALQCRNGKRYAQALDKLKEGISGEGYFSNSVCSVAISILCASGDLSDAYLLLQYLVLYCQEEISAIFFRRYAQLIMSVEELAKTDIEDLVVSYMQNSSKKSFFINNTYVPIINVPIGAGIFKSDVEYLKSAAPEEYEHYAIDAEKKCNESSERVFETLLDKLHGGTDAEGVWENDKKKDEQKAILQKKEFRFSDVITPENDFEAYTLHAFDVNYVQYANPSDEPEESIDAIKHQLHELSNIHCLFDKIFDEIIKPDVTIIEDTSMTKKSIMTMAENLCQQRAHTCIYTSDSLMWRVKETFMLIKLIVEQRKNITPDACTIVISLLYLVGDLSDAYLMLKYLAFYPSEEVQNNFLPGYVPLIASVEEITAKSLEEFIYTYIGVYIEGTKTKIVNIPVKSGIFKKDIEEIKHDKPEYYKRFLYNSEECNETTETIFETLSDRLHREAGEEEKDIEIKEKNKKTPETQYETKPTSSNNDRFLRGLDSDQHEAVTTTEGYVRVVASAGSGKTCALTYRFAYLVKCLNISPDRIACVTFTNKAAKEMKGRIRELTNCEPEYVCTFHSLGLKILKQELARIGWSKDYKVIDDADMEDLIKEACEQVSEPCYSASGINELKQIIAQYKTEERSYGENFAKNKSDVAYIGRNYGNVIAAYLRLQKQAQLLDFSDLICLPLYLFDKYPEVKEYWANRFDYIMVDEFQDVSGAQYDFAMALASKNHNLFVVGDPDQMIYSWRGAKMEYFMDFPKPYQGKTIYMNTNYRSEIMLVEAANRLISHNTNRIEKKSIAKRVDRWSPFEEIHEKTPDDVAESVAWQLKQWEMICSDENEIIYDFSKVAIIYRAHFLAAPIERALRKENIPYTIFSGPSFYQRREIKTVLSLLGVIVRDNVIDYKNFCKKYNLNINNNLLMAYLSQAEKSHTRISKIISHNSTSDFYEILPQVIKLQESLSTISAEKFFEDFSNVFDLESMFRPSTTEDTRLDNVHELLRMAKEAVLNKELSQGLLDFVNEISTLTSSDCKNEGVSLLTAHSAKGLEFDTVFCVGMNEGVFPFYKATTKEAMEEERRLAYVSVTRAKDSLYICEAECSGYNGRYSAPSRFIQEMEE